MCSPRRRMAPKKKAKGANGVAKVTDAGEKGTAAEAETGVRKYTREDLRSLVYHPVRPLDVISEEIGIKAEDIAKLDANENLHPVPAEMMKAVTDALQSFGSGCSAQIYPDPSQTNFRAAIAKLHGITPDMVVAGSGSDDILDIIMRIMDADSCIICPPTFGMYKFLGAITKIRIIEVARKDDFQVDIPAVVKAIRTNKCKLVMLPSPNNPTGTLLPNEDIKVLCAEDCIVCVDEAYAVCVCVCVCTRAYALVRVRRTRVQNLLEPPTPFVQPPSPRPFVRVLAHAERARHHLSGFRSAMLHAACCMLHVSCCGTI